MSATPSPLQVLIDLFPVADLLALLLFGTAWVGYAAWARRHASGSLVATTNRWRREWMLQATQRDNRMMDAAVTQILAASPAFFASTSILIIGGLLAALASSEQASELVRELPFAARTSLLVFDLKLVVLVAVFVFAFFRFSWSIRQYSFGAILVGAAPAETDAQKARGFAERAGRVMGLAAETFNDGLRAYYLSFAVLAWFFSAWAFGMATLLVVWVLYRREFHSEVLKVLRDDLPSGSA
jgi:uncharacterized membrane protein